MANLRSLAWLMIVPGGLASPECLAQTPHHQSLLHFSGLLRTPTAYTAPDGDLRLSFGRSWGNEFAFWRANPYENISASSATLGILPGVEVGFVGFYRNRRTTSFDDRAISTKVSVPLPNGARFAVGSMDIGGTRLIPTDYAVVSAPFGRVNASLGYGTTLGKRRNAELDGLFGGLYLPVGSGVSILAEHDTTDTLFGAELVHRTGAWGKVATTTNGKPAFAMGINIPLGTNAQRSAAPVRRSTLSGPSDLRTELTIAQLGARLEELGMRDLWFGDLESTLEVAYTNPVYVDEVRALALVLREVCQSAPRRYRAIEATIQKEGVGVVTVRLPRQTYLDFLDGKLDHVALGKEFAAEYHDQLRGAELWRGKMFDTFDIALRPRVDYLLGLRPLPNKESLVVDASRRLGKGLNAIASGYLPVNNSLDDERGWQTSGAALEYSGKITPATFARATAGSFGSLGFAGKLEVAHQLQGGKYEISADAAHVGESGFSSPVFGAAFTYRDFELGLAARGVRRRYLAGDDGIQFELERRFDKADVTLYAGKTDAWTTLNYGGVLFRIPLGGDRGAPGPVRLRAADEFSLGYRAASKQLPFYDALQSFDRTRALDRNFFSRDRLHPEALLKRLNDLRG